MKVLLEYVRNIGYFLILMSLVSNVMPDNSYKKYCRMFCGLILMVLVINPFYDLLNLEGDLSDAFATANYRSQVADLENQLILNDNSIHERIIAEYEQLIIDECQGIANEEGVYILDVKVDIDEGFSGEIMLEKISITVTKDMDEYFNGQSLEYEENNKEDNKGNISIDKINVGSKKNVSVGEEKNSYMDPAVISLIERIGGFLKVDTSIINVIMSEGE